MSVIPNSKVALYARSSEMLDTWEPIRGAYNALTCFDVGSVPRVPITPEVGGVAKAFQKFGDGTNDVWYLLATINAPDDATAGSRLANKYPSVFIIHPGNTTNIVTGTVITRLDVVAIGDTTSGTLASGEIVTDAESEANTLTASVQFDFDSDDDVRSLSLFASDRVGAAGSPVATANYVSLIVQGGSYAE